MSGRRGLKIQNFPSIPPLPRFFLRIYQNPLLSLASPLSFAEISVLFSRSGISVDRNQISSSREAADLGMASGDFTGIHRTGSKCHSKSKKQSSCTLPLKKKKNTYVTFEVQQSSDEEELNSDTEDSSIDDTELCQQSSDEEELDNDTKDSSIAKMDSLHRALGCGMALSSKPEQTRSKNVRNGGSGHTPYFPDDSTACHDSPHRALGCTMASSSKPEQTRSKNVRNGGSGHTPYFPDDSTACHDSPHRALGRDMASSSKPEQRSKNVRNGGSGHTPYFPDDSNRCSTFINRGNVKIVNNYSCSPTINRVGHTFIQNGGSRDSRQFQAAKVSGGTVTQGNVEDDLEDDG